MISVQENGRPAAIKKVGKKFMLGQSLFYVFGDESGNTGDVVVQSPTEGFLFDGQPYFVLAGIGTSSANLPELQHIVEDLRKQYRIQGKELKSSSLYGSKPGLGRDLLEMLWHKDYAVFVELTDKKYMLCTQVSNVICFPLLELHWSNNTLETIRGCADFLYDFLPARVFYKFSVACQSRKGADFNLFLGELRQLLLADETAKRWGKMLDDTLQYCATVYRREPLHYLLLPLPDRDNRGKLISALPHISSLSAIAARAEKYRLTHHLAGPMIIHDEQHQLWPILTKNVEFLRQHDARQYAQGNELENRVSYYLPDAQFEVRNSVDEPAIQAADIVAGFTFRIWRDLMQGQVEWSSAHRHFAGRLLDYPSKDPTCGFNMVVPQNQVDKFEAAFSR